MNQSKLNVIMCSWREARENVCERLTNAFGFTSDWMKNGASFFKPTNHITWYSKCKTSYFLTPNENRSNLAYDRTD